MKKSTLALSVMLLAASSYLALSSTAQPTSEVGNPNQWLFKNLQKIEHIKIGSTRRAVDTLFQTRAGVQALNPVVLVYRKSPYIFVQVTYQTKHDSQGRVIESPNDTVASISRPYLENWPYAD